MIMPTFLQSADSTEIGRACSVLVGEGFLDNSTKHFFKTNS